MPVPPLAVSRAGDCCSESCEPCAHVWREDDDDGAVADERRAGHLELNLSERRGHLGRLLRESGYYGASRVPR